MDHCHLQQRNENQSLMGWRQAYNPPSEIHVEAAQCTSIVTSQFPPQIEQIECPNSSATSQDQPWKKTAVIPA